VIHRVTLHYTQAIFKNVELAVPSEIRKILMNDVSDLYYLSETYLQDPASSCSQLQAAYANLQKKWAQYKEVLERFWLYFSAQWGFSGRFPPHTWSFGQHVHVSVMLKHCASYTHALCMYILTA
jgi:hypothetical protein